MSRSEFQKALKGKVKEEEKEEVRPSVGRGQPGRSFEVQLPAKAAEPQQRMSEEEAGKRARRCCRCHIV